MVGIFDAVGGDFVLLLVSASFVSNCCCLDVRIEDGGVGG